MKLPTLKEIVEKTRYEKETGEKYDPNQLEDIYNQYKSRKDPYLSFRYVDVPKMGLNPESKYDTPVGLCAYPAIYLDYKKFETGKVPFAGDKPYIVAYAVKPEFQKNILIVDKQGSVSSKSKITEQQLLEILEEHKHKEPAGHRVATERARIKTTPGIYWNTLRLFSSRKPSRWTKMMIDDGIYGVIDEGSGIVHPSEPQQSQIYNPQAVKLLAIARNPSKEAEEPSGVDFSKLSYGDLMDIAKGSDVIERQELAYVEDLPEDIMMKLAGDTDYNVRLIIAHNEGASEKVLLKILKREDEYIDIVNAAKNNLRTNLSVPIEHRLSLKKLIGP